MQVYFDKKVKGTDMPSHLCAQLNAKTIRNCLVDNREFIKSIGQKVLSIRQNRKMSQLDLAVISGLERTQIGRVERGEVNPTVETLKIIADALEINIKDFFD